MTTKLTPELAVLRDEARSLGIKFHHLTGEATLTKLIYDFKNSVSIPAQATAVPEPLFDVTVGVAQETPSDKLSGPPEWRDDMLMTEAEYLKGVKAKAIKDVNRLIRIRIQCMNPSKRKWDGEFISVGSSRLGTFKKFIPFNSGEPYHVPKIIYDYLMEKECSVFYNANGPHGQKIKKSRLIKEFAIELLNPLTPAEIKALAQTQAMAKGSAA